MFVQENGLQCYIGIIREFKEFAVAFEFQIKIKINIEFLCKGVDECSLPYLTSTP